MKLLFFILMLFLSLTQLNAQEITDKQIDQLKKDLGEQLGKRANQLDVSILNTESYNKHKELLEVLKQVKDPITYNEDTINISIAPNATPMNVNVGDNLRLLMLPSNLNLKSFSYLFTKDTGDDVTNEENSQIRKALSMHLTGNDLNAHMAMINSTCMKGPSKNSSLMQAQNRDQLVKNLARATRSQAQDFNHSAHFNLASIRADNPIAVFERKRSNTTYVVEQKTAKDGLNYTLPQFSDQVLIGWDFVDNDPYPFPPHSPFENNGADHGTMVSSVYLQDKDIQLFPLKVGLENDITFGRHYKNHRKFEDLQKRIDSAIALAIANKARIINFSFGDRTPGANIGLYKLVEKYARQNPETIFLLSAGNQIKNMDSPFEMHFPFGHLYEKGSAKLASFENVWQVPSVTHEGKLSKSVYGKVSTHVAVQGEGVTVSNERGEEKTVNGTSFATPNLGVLIARMLAIRPSMSAREVKQFIMDYSTFDESLVGKVKSNSYINPEIIIAKLEEYNIEHPETDRPKKPSFCDYFNFGCEKNR